MSTHITSRGPAQPAVAHAPIRPGLLRVVNPVFTAILRSRAHRILDGAFRPRLLLLTVTGRRTGRRYTIVVGGHDIDGVLSVFTTMPWRLNLRGGADVEVTLDGRTSAGHAALVEDPDEVAHAYAVVIGRIGWKAAQRQLALRINVRRAPTHDELLDAVRRERLSVVRLTEP